MITLDYTPSTATAALSPSGAHVGDTLTATTEVTDSDCDGDSIPTFVWKVNGVVTKTTVGTKGQTTDTFSTSALKTSDVVTVTVTPHEYTSAAPQTVGRVTTWTETTTQLGGSTGTHQRVDTTASVDSTTGVATIPSTVDAIADEIMREE